MLDLILTELDLAQIFYNVQDRKNKKETSSARLHSFTHSYNCGQNYWHIGTLGTDQQNRFNSKRIVSRIGDTSGERTVSFQSKEQTFSPHYAFYQNHVLGFKMLPFQLLFHAAVP